MRKLRIKMFIGSTVLWDKVMVNALRLAEAIDRMEKNNAGPDKLVS